MENLRKSEMEEHPMDLSLVLGLLIVASLLALAYAVFNFHFVKKLKEGNGKMREIAAAIRLGADTFIRYEYKIIAVVASVVAVLLLILISWQAACAFIIGAIMSASAGWIGMRIATYANVRVTNTALETKQLSKTLQVALRGGSVMGLCVGGFALLGIFIVYLVFGQLLGQIADLASGNMNTNWLGLHAPYTMTLSGYALGCSMIAIFARIGGGIYTKAADMGADLVGKTEAHIPEDDPRNPATIADNVGDNVGDVAGLGSDLLESYVGSIMSAAILAAELFRSHGAATNVTLLNTMIIYPLAFAACGLIACVIGLWTVLSRKKLSENPHHELNLATWISAGITLALGAVVTVIMYKGYDPAVLSEASFRFGAISPWLAASCGVAAGIVIGMLAEYYTSDAYKPTKSIANASEEGPALTITQGLATGMVSTMAPVAVLAAAIYAGYLIGGIYGIAMGAIGMLSFVATTVSVDTYGPISDNAGGIAEMSGLPKEVRKITDKLDSVGNTTAAIGKGFAIGSAALATTSMLVSYLFSYTDPSQSIVLNLVDPLTLAGALVGTALPYLFSGMLIEAVARAARNMVQEVRRQFREIKGLLTGEAQPDYKTCIQISSKGALREMIKPSMISILFPVVTGFIFGPEFVGGVLIGATLSAIMLAIFTGNAGGAWDNAKKYIEGGGIAGQKKGGPAHDAAVVGDTVGDPLKDTVGPSLDILIKIMSTISLVAATVFARYNILSLFIK